MFNFTAIWVFYLLFHMVASAYFSYRSNLSGEKLWFVLVMLLGMLPVWAIVSKYSKNLAADGMLYDTVITLVYYPALLYFTGTLGTMQWYHWLGFVMAIGGAMLVRL